MKPPQGEKPPITVKMPQPPAKKSKVDANLVVTLISGLLAIIFAYVTHSFFSSEQSWIHLSDAKFKKFNNQIQALSELAFTFSIYILVVTTVIFILTHFLNKDHDSPLVLAFRRVISNSLEQFIIFFGLYAYVVTQKGLGLSKEELIMIGNWFLFARYFYLFGSVLELVTRLNFKEIGVVLNTITLCILIGQVLGLNLLNFI